MKWLVILVKLLLVLAYGRQPFQSLEGAVGYIVVEKGGRVENYVVVEGNDGSVKTIKVDRNPAQFMRKTAEPKEGAKK